MTHPTIDEIVAKQETAKSHLAELDQLIAHFKATPPVRISLDMKVPVQPGETYIGLILHKGVREGHHIILLAGESTPLNWKDAKAWAAEQGGDLPSRPEQALLFADFRDEFLKEAYWSNTGYEGNADYAWCQGFDYGSQDNCSVYSNELRARAVRRLTFSL